MHFFSRIRAVLIGIGIFLKLLKIGIEIEEWFEQVGDQMPVFLISKHAKDFWKKQFYTFLIISLVLVALIFLLVKNKNNFPILTGSLLIAGFLPIILISNFASKISELILPDLSLTGLSFNLNSIIQIFFGKSNSVFLTGIIIGIILIGLGILFKALEIGIEVEEWIEGKDEGKKE